MGKFPNHGVRLKFELRHNETPEDRILRLNPETLQFEVQSDDAAQVMLVVATVAELGRAQAEQVGNHCSKTRQCGAMA